MSPWRAGVARVRIHRDIRVLDGPDALSYLQGQCSNDVEALEPGAPCHAFLLEPTGTVVSLVRIVPMAPDRILIDTDGGGGPAMEARLRRFKLRSRFDIVDPRWQAVGIRGPESVEVARALDGLIGAAGGAGGAELSVPWSWGGIVGRDYLGPDPDGWLEQALGADVPPMCAPEEWEGVRILAGVPVSTRDLDQDTVPAETGLLGRAVSFTKGCYTGQELVARMDARGNHAVRHLRGLRFSGGTPATVVGAALVLPGRDRPVGTVSSAAPATEGIVGMALVHRSVVAGAVVEVAGTDITAEVVDLPAP